MHSRSTEKLNKSQDVQPLLKLRYVVHLAKNTGHQCSRFITNPVSIAQEPHQNLCFGSLTCNTDTYSNHLCKAIPDNIYWVGTYFLTGNKPHEDQFVSVYLLKFLLAGSKLFTQLGTFFFKSTPYFLELRCFTFFISQVFFFQNLEEK